jgi:hypothetical protein
VLHNDNTGRRVLRMECEPSDERTGVFTSGIVSTGQGRDIALYFTGRQHAGDNLADVLQQRAPLAGFEVSLIGRCSGVPRGSGIRCRKT